MRHPGRNMSPLPRNQMQDIAVDLEASGPREHKEELLGVPVVVGNLGTPSRHTLLDNASFWRFKQVPAIALLTPGVVLRVIFADCWVSHIRFCFAPAQQTAQSLAKAVHRANE